MAPAAVAAPGDITTVAGTYTAGFSGDGGPATSAELNGPTGLALDGAGNLYIADLNNHVVRKVDGSGTITKVAGTGTGTPGFSGDGGPATSADLNRPYGLAVDDSGNLYIADSGNSRVRKVDGSGTITTVAGTGTQAFSGDGGPATSAELSIPTGLAVDGAGNLYIADGNNQRVRKVDGSGTITTVAGTGSGDFSGDGGPATSAELHSPNGVALDGSGDLYIADVNNLRVRKVDGSGTITTVAGTDTQGFSGDGGPATSAELDTPQAVAVDGSGNLYIADRNNQRVRKVDGSGRITTVAGTGTGTPGFSGDGGRATSAELNFPIGVAVDGAGNLYIADRGNHRVRMVEAGDPLNGPPVAQNQGVTTREETAKQITLAATDPDDDPLTYSSVSAPSHGSLTGTAPNLTYTPTNGYTGPDSFTFKANDGTIDSNVATVSITVTSKWSLTGSMARDRLFHTATPLPNGKVLVAGGDSSSGFLARAELYSPATGEWTPTSSMAHARNDHTATPLPNGKVLVAGGGPGGPKGTTRTSAELYSPATGKWTPTGSMADERALHTATLLPGGKVLVAGGGVFSVALPTAELYSPATGKWTPTGSMAHDRYEHTATPLPNGKVLVAGGVSDNHSRTSAELYSPATGKWTPTGSMAHARYDHTATLLGNGKVLVAGGQSGNTSRSTAELYSPATGKWTPTGSMAHARVFHTATLLPNGKVLVVGGGGSNGTSRTSAELYSPATGKWTPAGSMAHDRVFHTATPLPNGKVLVVGGGSSTSSDSAELYTP